MAWIVSFFQCRCCLRTPRTQIQRISLLVPLRWCEFQSGWYSLSTKGLSSSPSGILQFSWLALRLFWLVERCHLARSPNCGAGHSRKKCKGRLDGKESEMSVKFLWTFVQPTTYDFHDEKRRTKLLGCPYLLGQNPNKQKGLKPSKTKRLVIIGSSFDQFLDTTKFLFLFFSLTQLGL